MESVLESQMAPVASIAPGLSIFLPTTSPLSGGLMLRVHPQRPAELILPNPFGAGVLVAPPDRLDDFGFSPSAFDRVLIRRIIAMKPVTVRDVRDSARATALSGFAGREAQVLARRVADVAARRQRVLRDQLVSMFIPRGASPDLPDWLAGVLLQTGIAPSDLSSILRPATSSRSGPFRPTSSVSGAPPPVRQPFRPRFSPQRPERSGAPDKGGVPEARVPPRLALMREVIGGLSDILPPDYNGTSAGRCLRLAEDALTRIEALYTSLAELLVMPDRLAALVPARNPFAADLGLLAGWNRFCLMAREVARAPCRAHAVADIAALAQVLGHRNSAGTQDMPGANTPRPGLSGWPQEIDHAVWLSERNERLLRAEIALDAGRA